MFSKVLRRATHNGSVDSWAFHDDTFTEATKDKVFMYQISHQDIKTITPKTLVFGNVCGKIMSSRCLISAFCVVNESEVLRMATSNASQDTIS